MKLLYTLALILLRRLPFLILAFSGCTSFVTRDEYTCGNLCGHDNVLSYSDHRCECAVNP